MKLRHHENNLTHIDHIKYQNMLFFIIRISGIKSRLNFVSKPRR